jgi:hypothetical protein
MWKCLNDSGLYLPSALAVIDICSMVERSTMYFRGPT